ncbi:ubiquitin-related domain-containing protein [Podospora aff. communis PSN243]|uniref:Ubiquitin-related domain-containing protein n=1 Tax=Podospora aff. communis PSN243 TaxID=3040156 RepID=A0AAV9GHL4_9PEZI|nr:ubiquitin-related domain-containing protein [Podospora aff. communis PSN243]
MGQSDLEVLLDMGFDKARAELAVKKTGGLQGALNWLEENQDTPIEELQAAGASTVESQAEGSDSAVLENLNAKSLVCNECGKKFRNHDAASFHASKTDHQDFSESTDEIAPLTEEEKKAKLEELRQQLAAKRAAQAVADKEEQKKNEVCCASRTNLDDKLIVVQKIRQKSTKETQEAKEELQRKQQINEAAKKRQEKLDDLEAKKRIKARIEADRAERKRKDEEAKAAREGRAVAAAAPAAAAAAPSAPKPASAHTEARLRLQLPSKTIQKTYPADTTLFEVAQQLEADEGTAVTSFTMNFPRKTFEGGIDFSQTLKEAGLVPSAVLIVK